MCFTENEHNSESNDLEQNINVRDAGVSEDGFEEALDDAGMPANSTEGCDEESVADSFFGMIK